MTRTRNRSIRAIVFDLNGVFRDWDVDEESIIEARHGLPIGSIGEVAMRSSSFADMTTGVISDEQWREAVASDLAHQYGDTALEAVAEWSQLRGLVRGDVLAYAQELRIHFAVALLTNASSRLARDLQLLGLSESFDYVFCSAEIGLAKPSVEVFAHVSRHLGLEPREWLFVDDTRDNVEGAESAGVRAHHFKELSHLRDWIDAQLAEP